MFLYPHPYHLHLLEVETGIFDVRNSPGDCCADEYETGTGKLAQALIQRATLPPFTGLSCSTSDHDIRPQPLTFYCLHWKFSTFLIIAQEMPNFKSAAAL